MPGAFKLDHLQPLKPILFSRFQTFSLLYWEANSYYPRGLIMEKGILPTSEMDDTHEFDCLGHSNWTICSLLSQFCSLNFSTFLLSYSGQF